MLSVLLRLLPATLVFSDSVSVCDCIPRIPRENGEDAINAREKNANNLLNERISAHTHTQEQRKKDPVRVSAVADACNFHDWGLFFREIQDPFRVGFQQLPAFVNHTFTFISQIQVAVFLKDRTAFTAFSGLQYSFYSFGSFK